METGKRVLIQPLSSKYDGQMEKSSELCGVEQPAVTPNGKADNRITEHFVGENEVNRTTEILSDEFEFQIEALMANLELVEPASIKINSDCETLDEKLAAWKCKVFTKVSPPMEYNDEDGTITQTANCSDDDAVDGVTENSNLDPFRSPESITHKLLYRPHLLPFQERRRLSQCKEEDEEEAAEKKLRHKFIVTKTESIPRPEAANLRNMTARQNAATISFPCSSSTQRPSLKGAFFSPQREFSPHLDKRFFDTSLVEIREINTSTKSLHKSADILDDLVWVPRISESNDASTTSNVRLIILCITISISFTFIC